MQLLRITVFILTLMTSFLGWSEEPILASSYPQSHLWALQESGQQDRANALEAFLKNILSSSELREVSTLGGGHSDSWLVRFPGNILAVLKSADHLNPRSPYYEAAAYELDRLLGLNLVPMTVVRKIGGVAYSLQIFYPTSFHFRSKPNLERIGKVFLKNIDVLDALIVNQDRVLKSAHNALEGFDQRLVAIDHGRTFVSGFRSVKIVKGGSLAVKDKLLSLNSEDLRPLASLLDAKEFAELVQRLNNFKNEIPRLSWEAVTYKAAVISPLASYQTPAELKEHLYVDLNFFKTLFPQKFKANPLIALKELLLDPPTQGSFSDFLFSEWPHLSSMQKKEVLRAMTVVVKKKQLLPEQALRLIQRYPDDVLILDKALNVKMKSTFAYAAFVHSISQSASEKVLPLAAIYLRSDHGPQVLARSFFMLDSDFKNKPYQDLYIQILKEHVAGGHLRWSDLLSVPQQNKEILQKIIAESDHATELENILNKKMAILDGERKEQALQFVEKIKRAVKAPLCHMIFN